MYFATFHTPSPIPPVQRALDELGRAGFELIGFHLVTSNGTGERTAHVRIDYSGKGSISADTFLQRFMRISDVSGVLGGAVFVRRDDAAALQAEA